MLRDAEGYVVGTAGVRCLSYKPDIAAVLARRYSDVERVAFNGRLYVDPRRRGRPLR